MHLPDGALGSKTCVVFFAALLPFWYFSLRSFLGGADRGSLRGFVLAVAFLFAVMMPLFDYPVPIGGGGGTGHIVGAALVAMLLGPWAAFLATSLVIAAQAILLGDGGVTAIGVNSFNMALVMSFSGYAVYRGLSGAGRSVGRFGVAAAAAAYVAVLMAAFFTNLEAGIYSASSLMPHLFFIAPVEAAATALVVSVFAFKRSGSIELITLAD